MKVIYKDKFQIVEKEYPNVDITKPINGLNQIKVDGIMIPLDSKSNDRIEYYYINETKTDNENPEKFDLIKLADELTNKQHDILTHLKVCNRKWVLVEKPKEQIIQKLNDELGIYLDSIYPIWERTKHNAEGSYIILSIIQKTASPENLERKKYLEEMLNWVTECRQIRQQREIDYLEFGKFPEFGNYPDRPM
jgi:hypothetical protein